MKTSRRVRLYEKYTADELAQQLNAIPQQKQPDSIYLYTKAQRTRMEDITWAIRYHLQDAKAQVTT